MPELPNLSEVFTDKPLPEFVFAKKFDHYGFFDNPLGDEINFAGMLERFFLEELQYIGLIHEFSPHDGTMLGSSKLESGWAAKHIATNRARMRDGYCGGLVLIPSDGSWGIHQRWPVEEGVLGYNGSRSLREVGREVKDYFFDCADLNYWCYSNTKRARAMRQNYNENFFRALLANYGTATVSSVLNLRKR